MNNFQKLKACPALDFADINAYITHPKYYKMTCDMLLVFYIPNQLWYPLTTFGIEDDLDRRGNIVGLLKSMMGGNDD